MERNNSWIFTLANSNDDFSNLPSELYELLKEIFPKYFSCLEGDSERNEEYYEEKDRLREFMAFTKMEALKYSFFLVDHDFNSLTDEDFMKNVNVLSNYSDILAKRNIERFKSIIKKLSFNG